MEKPVNLQKNALNSSCYVVDWETLQNATAKDAKQREIMLQAACVVAGEDAESSIEVLPQSQESDVEEEEIAPIINPESQNQETTTPSSSAEEDSNQLTDSGTSISELNNFQLTPSLVQGLLENEKRALERLGTRARHNRKLNNRVQEPKPSSHNRRTRAKTSTHDSSTSSSNSGASRDTPRQRNKPKPKIPLLRDQPPTQAHFQFSSNILIPSISAFIVGLITAHVFLPRCDNINNQQIPPQQQALELLRLHQNQNQSLTQLLRVCEITLERADKYLTFVLTQREEEARELRDTLRSTFSEKVLLLETIAGLEKTTAEERLKLSEDNLKLQARIQKLETDSQSLSAANAKCDGEKLKLLEDNRNLQERIEKLSRSSEAKTKCDRDLAICKYNKETFRGEMGKCKGELTMVEKKNSELAANCPEVTVKDRIIEIAGNILTLGNLYATVAAMK